MLHPIPFDTLGRFDNDWLSARYHFSFAHYLDPDRMGWGPLRVWNDDAIRPDGGFDLHPHRDMEIITYVRAGAISHRDHLGHEGRTAEGDIQVMSAGTGILHAEFNYEPEVTRIFQIWIEPRERGLAPRWEQRHFPREVRRGRFRALASGRGLESDKADGALTIHQDAALLGTLLGAGDSLGYDFAPRRRGYLVVAEGRVRVNGEALGPRDGLAIAEEPRLEIEAAEASEVLLADLP